MQRNWELHRTSRYYSRSTVRDEPSYSEVYSSTTIAALHYSGAAVRGSLLNRCLSTNASNKVHSIEFTTALLYDKVPRIESRIHSLEW